VSLACLLCAHSAYAQANEPDPPSAESSGDEALSDEPGTGPSIEALSLAELDALGLEAEGPRVDTDLHFWGFADFNSSLLIRPTGGAALAQGRNQNFFIGNLNLYLSKNLSESFRTMAEVRLTYLPNGSYSASASGYEQVDTSTVDYANGQSLTRWGGIILQRVYLEWTVHPLFAVRGGQFLTPFGVWNVDHGSPAYIPAQRPLAVVSGLFPVQQVGFEIFGRFSPDNRSTFGYHLTLSNGSGPISEYKDFDRNKAVGGRVYCEYFGKSYVRSGISGYYGRDTNATPTATLMGSKIGLGNKLDSQSDVLAIAADVVLKRGGLHLQTEWVTKQIHYTESGRAAHAIFAGPIPTAASADTFSWVGYMLAAYRFSWFGITPFSTLQVASMGQLNRSLPDTRLKVVGFTVGLDVSPIDSVVFKMEYANARFPQAAPILKHTVNALLFQIAWAF
jgi:hypothetical protein